MRLDSLGHVVIKVRGLALAARPTTHFRVSGGLIGLSAVGPKTRGATPRKVAIRSREDVPRTRHAAQVAGCGGETVPIEDPAIGARAERLHRILILDEALL